jgi:hypothetical protein
MAIELSNVDRNGKSSFRTDLGKQRQDRPMRTGGLGDTIKK